MAMWTSADVETMDIMQFARSIERDCQEVVKWEIRKLKWIIEEEEEAAKRPEPKDSFL